MSSAINKIVNQKGLDVVKIPHCDDIHAMQRVLIEIYCLTTDYMTSL